jgi:hypothetical protein
MLKHDPSGNRSDHEHAFPPAAPRCVGNVRSASVINQDVSRLLDMACAEQAAVVSHIGRGSDLARDPSRLWVLEEPSDGANPRAAILTVPVWDETADRLIPQGCCLAEDDASGQVKLTWRYGPSKQSALLSKDAYHRLLDSATIFE